MRIWELRDHGTRYDYDSESEYGHHMGMREKSASEAYECGYEDGYEAAMEEVGMHSDHRSNYRRGRRSMR